MNVLYLSYNGALEPLGESQVLSYLRGLSERGHRFALLSYEKERDLLNRPRAAALRADLERRAIRWRPLRYHQRPTLPATLFDVAHGLPHALRLARRLGAQALHVRSYIPLLIALPLKRLLRIPLIFDMRGLWADERADGGQCSRGGRQYRAIKALERAGLRGADQVVVLAERVKGYLSAEAPLRDDPRPITVIPCGANLARFQQDQQARAALRARHGWQDQRVAVYAGSLGGLYLSEELAELFAIWAAARDDLHLLVLTRSDERLIREPLERRGVAPARYTIASALPEEMPRWLSAADLALSLIKPSFSKIASSPTKQAEYLACGLPTVANAGIGDVDALLRDHQVGVVLDEWGPAAYCQALGQALELLGQPGLPERCRAVAAAELSAAASIERYDAIYRALGQEGGR